MEDSKSEGIVMDRTGITMEEYLLGVMTKIIPLSLNFIFNELLIKEEQIWEREEKCLIQPDVVDI